VWQLCHQELLPTLMGSIAHGDATPPIYIIFRLQIVEVPALANDVFAAMDVQG
jgi:hypothetical protein